MKLTPEQIERLSKDLKYYRNHMLRSPLMLQNHISEILRENNIPGEGTDWVECPPLES